MADRTLCVHCGRRISFHNFALGPGWSHDDSTFEGYTYCRTTAAAPAPETKEQQ